MNSVIKVIKKMNFKKTKVAKITTGVVGALTALAMAGGVAVLPAFAAEDLASQIAALMAQIQVLQAKLAASPSAPVAVGSYNFATNLTLGSRGADVLNLQKVLNSDVDTKVSVSGAGSPGNETEFFGPATKAAVMKFQQKHGIAPVAGYVGAITRAKLNSMFASVAPVTPVTPVTPASPAAAGTLVVRATSVQPTNALAPKNATRIPFTKFTVTAGATDVPLSNITVERTGNSVDAALDSVVLMDENGDQIGLSKTLNSSNRATVGDPMVIKAGTSRTFTIGANRPNSADHGGTTISLDVVAINTTATVVGDVLPIRGATHTINSTLIIGGADVSRGGIDPGTSQEKEIGSIGVTFSSIKVSSQSTEAITLKSIRWNQVESAGIADLANMKTYVDGVAYDAVSIDGGRYFTSTFGNGILIDKGFSKDISIKGDIIGGSARKVRFDVAKKTDINVIGNVFGYGILPDAVADCGTSSCFNTTEDPWYKGSTITMNNGKMTVSSDNTVSSQNIGVNIMNQPLGGFKVDVRGEPISVGKIIFDVTVTGTTVDKITNVVLVDENGSVLAGPVDGVGAATTGTFTFTDSVTFQTGKTSLSLKGKLANTVSTGNTVVITTTPATKWTTVRGQVTGNTVTPEPAGSLGNTVMTAKAGALNLSVSATPTSQTVISGASSFEFARFFLDAGDSGEIVRMVSLPLNLAVSGVVTGNNLTSCQLYDGSVSVTDQNIINPTLAVNSSVNISFNFNGTGLEIPKGTSKNLSLKCNVASGITGTIIWGLDNSASYTGASGKDSGQTIAESFGVSTGPTMTLATSGWFSVSKDQNAAYAYSSAVAGNEISLAAFKINAGPQEGIKVEKLAFILANQSSSTPSDLGTVTLWVEGVNVGTVNFGNSYFATTTLSTPITVAKEGTKTVVVKATTLAHSSIQGNPGAFLAISFDGTNNGLNGTYAKGVDSQGTIYSENTLVTTDGVRVFRNVPTIQVTSPSSHSNLEINTDLYTFKVSNTDTARDLLLKRVTFSVSTSTGLGVYNYTLYADGAAVNATPVYSQTAGLLAITFDQTSSGKIVPAKGSKTYVLKAASVEKPSGTGTDTLSIALKGDTSYPSLVAKMGTVANLGTSFTVWSPQSTTTQDIAGWAVYEGYTDWTNSYGLPGVVLGGDYQTVNISKSR